MTCGLLSDAPRFHLYMAELRDTLTRWRDAGLALDSTMEESPALQEARPLARDLSAAASAGLEALSYTARGVAPSDEWRDAKLAALEQAAKPKAALELVIVNDLRRLVYAASLRPRLKDMTPADWKRHVIMMAVVPTTK